MELIKTQVIVCVQLQDNENFISIRSTQQLLDLQKFY
jgi:hypothetical protein